VIFFSPFLCASIIDDLWHLLDSTIDHSRRRSGTTVEVDRYLSEVNLSVSTSIPAGTGMIFPQIKKGNSRGRHME